MSTDASRDIRLLNRLLAMQYHSFPMYLRDADPWRRAGDERGATVVADIAADHQAMARQIADRILELGGALSPGEFPMEYTDTHFLSLDFLIGELIRYTRDDLAVIEQLAAAVGDRRGRELAEETLGAERAHLEALEDVVRQPV
jgi:bacterioferritin (cytochrome b1)